MSRGDGLAVILFALVWAGCSRSPQVVLAKDFEKTLRLEGQDRLPTALAYADFLVGSSAAAPEGPAKAKDRERAKTLYREVCRYGSGEVRLRGCNNLCAVLLKDGEPSAARELLGAIQVEMYAAAYRDGLPRYLFNWGRSLEETGSPAEALDALLEAVAVDAGFEPAVQAVYRISRSLSAGEKLSVLGRLVRSLAQQGHSATAGEYLRAALQEATAGTSVPMESFLSEVARYLAAAQVQPAEFESSWRPLFAGLMPKFEENERVRTRSMAEAYTSDFESIDLQQAFEIPEQEIAAGWNGSPEDRRIFSNLLRSIGGIRTLKGEPLRGTVLQAFAWRLDPANLEAAVDLAVSLKDEPSLDPSGRILRLLASRASGGEVPEAERDVASRLHSVLGRASFERGVFGSKSDPGSAIYHWTRAIEIQQDDALAEAGQQPPLLIASLGSAYEGAGDWRQALYLYRQAIYGFTVSGDEELAMGLMRRHEVLDARENPSVDSVVSQWIQGYNQRFEELVVTPVDPVHLGMEKQHQQPASEISRTILFAWDSDSLSDAAKEELKKLNELVQDHLAQHYEVKIRIEGHTDSTGPNRYNYNLGLRRAEAVWRYLIEVGVQAETMSITSYGEDRLEVSGDSEEAHKLNRRALVVLVSVGRPSPQ